MNTDTKQFLESVLGDEGFYCIVGLKQDGSKTVQKFYGSLEDATFAAQNLDNEGFDAYYGLATFTEAGSRKNDNVSQMRSLFLDLDCGASKDYPDQAEAIKDLRRFCSELNLPKPTLVNSGRGVHVYWFLNNPVSREEWLPIAESLKNACKNHNLRADPAVTADSARILRVPGTQNYKDDPPKAVRIMGELGKSVDLLSFKNLLGSNVVVKAPYVPRELDPLTQMLAGSYTSRFKTIISKTQAGRGCAQLAKVITEQETISEPMWRAGLSVAAFCVDRDKAVHFISKKHPEYTPERTESKVALIKGPYTCAKFEEYNPGGCEGCVHHGKIKSPITLGKEVIEATEEDNIVQAPPPPNAPPTAPIQTYQIPKFPHPYFRGKNGGVFAHGKNKAGDEVELLIYHNDLYALRRIRDQVLGESLMLRLHLPRDGVRDFTVPLTAILAKDEFRKHVASQGVAATNLDGLMEYVAKWVNHLQMQTTADEARTQYGWTGDAEDPRSFVIGEKEIFGNRIELNPVSGKTASTYSYFTPKGTLDDWKRTVDFLNQPNFELHQYMVGIGFGAPLMHFTAIHAVLFHAYSKDSGLGKTTAMMAGASIWGDPTELVLFEKDTVNTKMNRAEVYKNLPLYMDEMTNTAPKDLSDFGYQLPSGKQRNRLGPNGNTERYRGMPWKFSAASTGNTSMIERISAYKAMPKAEAARILEYRVSKTFFGDKSITDKFSKELQENFGHAGEIYIQYILNNLAEVKALLSDVQKKFDTAAGLQAEDRFWSVQCATTLTGLMLAKKLGLVNFSIKDITKWLLGVIESAKRGLDGMGNDPEAILADYLAEHYTSILRIKSTDDARGKPTDLEHLIIPDASPRFAMVARYEYDIKKLYLLPTPLKKWCVQHQINYSGLVDGLKRGRTKAVLGKQRMGKGTRMNLPSSPALILDCTEFLDDETEDILAAAASEKEILEAQN